jgi:endo-1,4-beta-xylanase
MRISASALLRACVFACLPLTAIAQNEPVVVEAESGTLGANLTIPAPAGGVTFITTTENSAVNPTAARTATYQVTFPAAGSYALYVRILTGPVGGNDDSFYVGNGFNTTTNWSGAYNTSTGGATAPGATVPVGGNAGQNVFKWVRLTSQVGGGGGTGPAAWVVPEGALTQTFAWGSREDGLLFDKFAFGPINLCYTVGDLDAGTAATGTCPPLPPPVPPAYTRVGSPLATGHEPKFLGSAHSGGNSLNFGAYWNQVTPENGGKWGSAQPQSPFGPAPDYVTNPNPVFNWTEARNAYNQARNNGQVFKWHVLFWGNQQPAWIESLPKAKQVEAINIWLAAIAREFPDLEQIEVVNEPLHDPPRGPTNGNYIEALGGTPLAADENWEWIANAFTLARQYFPNAKLMLNDYGITNDGNATTRYLEIINLLKARGLIDLVGVQAHAFEYNGADPAGTHRSNIARLAQTQLPIYATEFDIDGVDAVFGVQDDALQLARFQLLFPVFWENDAIKGITMWGYVQGGHWRTSTGAWLMYQNGAERPALQWLVRYMENKSPSIAAGQSFSVSESLPAGTAVGTVAVTDTDNGTVFSQWQLQDPSGKFAIDASSGALSLAAGQSLDFEAATSYVVSVSVWDGYVRSAAANVTINVTNANDNTPAITAGQAFDIDGGSHNVIDALEVSDADDINQLGFTTFSNYAIVSGNTNSVFRLRANSGVLEVARPLLVDWRKTSYTLTAKVSDGTNTSAAQAVTVNIPKRVDFCLANIIRVEVPKATAPLAVLLGGALGDCRRPL